MSNKRSADAAEPDAKKARADENDESDAHNRRSRSNKKSSRDACRAARPLRLPEGLLLAYPALNISLTPSPSRAVHNFDPVLPLGIMYSVLRMYPPAALRGQPYRDPCLSPYHCPDYLLRGFPPTHLMVSAWCGDCSSIGRDEKRRKNTY